ELAGNVVVGTTLRGRVRTPGRARSEPDAHGDAALRRLIERVGPVGLATADAERVALDRHALDGIGRERRLIAEAPRGERPSAGRQRDHRLLATAVRVV